MTGYATYQWYQRVEEQAKHLGFRLGHSKHGNYRQEFGDIVALFPAESALPVYSRDAEIFCGTFAEVEKFLAGWARAQQYDAMLRMTDDRRRKKFEAREVERQRVARVKKEQKEMWGKLANKSEKEMERISV